MRVLEINSDAQEKVDRVVVYARQHIYYPGPNAGVPGDDPKHVVHLNDYRCVFTFTKAPSPSDKLYRHLSISVPSSKYPSPEAVVMIAGLFGFTDSKLGLPEILKQGKWHFAINAPEHCIVVAEELK